MTATGKNRIMFLAISIPRTEAAVIMWSGRLVFVFDDLRVARHALLGRSRAGRQEGFSVGRKWLREHAVNRVRLLRALDPLRHGCVVADVRMPHGA